MQQLFTNSFLTPLLAMVLVFALLNVPLAVWNLWSVQQQSYREARESARTGFANSLPVIVVGVLLNSMVLCTSGSSIPSWISNVRGRGYFLLWLDINLFFLTIGGQMLLGSITSRRRAKMLQQSSNELNNDQSG